LKKDYQILIIFGTSIPDTTGHQMTVQDPTSPSVCFCTTWGKAEQAKHYIFIQCGMSVQCLGKISHTVQLNSLIYLLKTVAKGYKL